MDLPCANSYRTARVKRLNYATAVKENRFSEYPTNRVSCQRKIALLPRQIRAARALHTTACAVVALLIRSSGVIDQVPRVPATFFSQGNRLLPRGTNSSWKLPGLQYGRARSLRTLLAAPIWPEERLISGPYIFSTPEP